MNPSTLCQSMNLDQSRTALSHAKRAVNNLIKTGPQSNFVNLTSVVSALIKEIEVFEHLSSLELKRQATTIQRIKQVLKEDNQSTSTTATPTLYNRMTPKSQMLLQALPQHNQVSNQADIQNETVSQSEHPVLPSYIRV